VSRIAASYRGAAGAAIAAALAVAALAAAPAGAPPAPAGPARAGDAAGDFRAAVREALSRERDPAALRAHVSESVVEIAGEPSGRVRVVATREPRALREEGEIAGVRQVVTLLGDEGWIEDANGTVRPLSGDELFGAVLSHALLFHDYLERDELTWTERGETRHAALEWSDQVLFLRTDRGPPARLRFGAGGLPRELSQAIEGGMSTVSYRDWRPAGGVRWPFTSRQTTGDARFDLTLRTTSAAYPDELPPDMVPRPVPRSAADYAFTDSDSARDIAAERAGALLLVPVRVNGRAASFLLDTGAGATVLDAALADELGLERRGLVQARGAAGHDAATFVTVERLELPGVVLRGQTVVALDLAAVAAVLDRDVDGVLGYDFLSRFAVRLDYPAARIGLWPSGAYPPDSGAVRVPLRIESNVPRVDGVLNGTHRGSFLLDTGNSSPLLLHSPFVREHGLRGDGGGSFRVSGVGGDDSMESVSVDSLRIGDRVFTEVTALLARVETGAVALHGSIGNVGGALFQDEVLAFDYSAASLWIAPATAASASPR
jgi:predicted aspartyl protease